LVGGVEEEGSRGGGGQRSRGIEIDHSACCVLRPTLGTGERVGLIG
jgi:hypothetical protein